MRPLTFKNTIDNHPTNTMPSAVHTMTVAQNQWKGDVKAMMADGRLTKVNVVNGKTLYALDRKKLGMIAE